MRRRASTRYLGTRFDAVTFQLTAGFLNELGDQFFSPSDAPARVAIGDSITNIQHVR